MQSLYHFVANFPLFQKHWGHFWWFSLCEALQCLQASTISWLIWKTCSKVCFL